MGRIARFFVANWQVKVIAFFLAVALWLYTSGQARIERTLIVRVSDAAVHSLPSEYQVVAITPREFRVDVDGPSSLLGDLPLDPIEPRLEISAEALNRGHQTFPITVRALGLAADVRIQRIQPENVDGISVSFGRIVEGHLPVETPPVVDEPPGVDVSFSVDPTHVRVRGPENVISELEQRVEKIRFEPVSLRSVDPRLAEPTTLRLKLTPRELTSITLLDAVDATIHVVPRPSTKQILSLTVNLLVPPDFLHLYRVVLSQTQVAVTVHGPANLLQELQPQDVAVYLNLLRGIEPDVRRDVKLSVIGPAWATFDDVTVNCTVHIATPRAAPDAPSETAP